MITAKRYIAYILILFPLILDLIIACCVDTLNDIELQAKLLSYLTLKILLLITNELVTYSYKRQAQLQGFNQIIV